MAVKICRKCRTPKTVQPRADNSITYWTCMKCSGPHIIKREQLTKPLLRLVTSIESLRAA
jgi:RNase P subunit RPR2